jgi:hypothetical protein
MLTAIERALADKEGDACELPNRGIVRRTTRRADRHLLEYANPTVSNLVSELANSEPP